MYLLPDDFDPSWVTSTTEKTPHYQQCYKRYHAYYWQKLQPIIAAQKALFVFAYGSLIWKRGFNISAHTKYRLHHYARRFGLISTHYRGTSAYSGRVLGLDEGAYCDGILYKIDAHEAQKTADILWHREMVSLAYIPFLVKGTWQGEDIYILSFKLSKQHPQYCQGLSDDDLLNCLINAYGTAGSNAQYALQTMQCLEDANITDTHLHHVFNQLRTILGKQDNRPPTPIYQQTCPKCGHNEWHLYKRINNHNMKPAMADWQQVSYSCNHCQYIAVHKQ